MKESKRAVVPEFTRRSLGLLLLASLLTLSQRIEVYLPYCLNWPVAGETHITQKFWSRHPGIDIAARIGTPVNAISKGRIVTLAAVPKNRYHQDPVFVGESEEGEPIYIAPGVLGNFVRLAISTSSGKYVATYAHLQEVPDLQLGQEVLRGQIIGKIGMTGNTTGPHLHLEIAREPSPGERIPINPLPFFYNCQHAPEP